MSVGMALRSNLEQPAQCRVGAATCSLSAIVPGSVRYPRSYIDRYAQSDDRQIGVVVEDAALKKPQGSTFTRKLTITALHLIKPIPSARNPRSSQSHWRKSPSGGLPS
jgi:hypothetical protein